MGLQDRDWFRDEPSPAWKQLFRDSDESPHARRTSGAAYAPKRRRARATRLLWCFVVVAVIAVAALAGWTHRDPIRRAYDSATKLVFTRHAGSSNVIHLKPLPGLDRPVKVVTRWWATGRFGRVTVYVPVGETPRKALTVALAQRGYQAVG
jgi:hypothetical protein